MCRNLTRPLILGRDFLLQHHITVQYATDGKCILDYQQQELIASVDLEDEPQLHITHSVNIPGRTLAIVCVSNNLDPKQSRSLYEIEPNDVINEKYPNLCVIPMIHNVDVHRTEHLPLVVINFCYRWCQSFERRDCGFHVHSTFGNFRNYDRDLN